MFDATEVKRLWSKDNCSVVYEAIPLFFMFLTVQPTENIGIFVNKIQDNRGTHGVQEAICNGKFVLICIRELSPKI